MLWNGNDTGRPASFTAGRPGTPGAHTEVLSGIAVFDFAGGGRVEGVQNDHLGTDWDPGCLAGSWPVPCPPKRNLH